MEQVVTREVLGIEEVNEQGLPPGFRFHPTDEELITFYLASKVYNGTFCGVDIAEVDLNRCEPWELPDVAKMGEREWYFFSLRDRKYPTGLRTNRATGAGYWKATGKDREVCSAATGALLGMKKTLVFYKGRAPRGQKTKWVMHEYRLDGHFSSYRHTCKDERVICRIHDKSGDKRIPQHVEGQGQGQGQGGNFHQRSVEAGSMVSLPPLLECRAESTTHHHQQSSWTASSSSSSAALESMLFKSLLFSYQDHDHDQLAGHSNTNYTTTTTTVCKNEEAFSLSHFQTPPLNANYFNYLMGKNHSHPNVPELDLGHHHRNSSVLSDGHFRYYNDLLGLSTSTSTCTCTCTGTNCAVDNETTTSAIGGGFNRTSAFQTMLLDPLIKLPANSEY